MYTSGIQLKLQQALRLYILHTPAKIILEVSLGRHAALGQSGDYVNDVVGVNVISQAELGPAN